MASDSTTSDWRHITPLTAGTYAEWEPKAISELMRIGVYRLCTGEEIELPKPTPPVIAADASPTARSAAQREYKEDVRAYNEALRRSDKAIGTIRSIIAEDQLQHIEGKTTPKTVWDTLKEKHKDSTSGLAAYYIKIGILEKKYTEDKNMHTHLSFIQMENCKLPTAHSAGKVRFGSGSRPFALNAEPERDVRFGQPPNLEPERAFRFSSAFERVRTEGSSAISGGRNFTENITYQGFSVL